MTSRPDRQWGDTARAVRQRSLVWAAMALLLAGISVVAVAGLVGRHLDREAADRVDTARSLGAALLNTDGPRRTATAGLLTVLPYVTGVEVFSVDGRRIASFGEPLEIVGYRLDRETVRRHRVPGTARQEIYWPAPVLRAEAGLAVRFDMSPLERRRGRLTVMLASVQMAALAILGLLCRWPAGRRRF